MCPWEGEYLWNVAKNSSVGVLEIGRNNGGSTFLLACATDVEIMSIDKAPADDDLLRSLFARHDVGANVSLVVADSHRVYSHPAVIDLLFIDGDHTYEGCKLDIDIWHQRVVPGGSIVFHDCYEGHDYGVKDAVKEFAGHHPEFEVIKSPSIGYDYWTLGSGSIAHLRRCDGWTGHDYIEDAQTPRAQPKIDTRSAV